MKRSVILLVILIFAGITPSFSQLGKKGANPLSNRFGNRERAVQLQKEEEPINPSFETNTLFYISIDMGKAGLKIPAFIDLNSSPQAAYKIKSTDFMLQAAVEKKLAKSPIHGPVVFGIKGKAGLAFSYWPTQQGGGEPGNYFASNGSVFNAGTGLHSGDAINIKGFRWALSPDLAAHYSISSNLEAGAAVGPCLYGYALMTIKDPWDGYSTKISNTAAVGHSKFLTDHLKSFGVTIDWSANIVLKVPNQPKKMFLEIGMTGTAFNFGLGMIYPIMKKI
jgi:hypothetical protein